MTEARDINSHGKVQVRGNRRDPATGTSLGTFACLMDLTTVPASLTPIPMTGPGLPTPGGLNNLRSPQAVGGIFGAGPRCCVFRASRVFGCEAEDSPGEARKWAAL